MYDYENRYEERADYLLDSEIIEWNVESEYFQQIQKRLIEKGSKIIVGPRGCGKTHQMRIAFKTCIEDENKPFPIYVSFSRYYFLEPLLTKDSEAIKIFHTWVLSLIILSCNNSYKILTDNEINLGLNGITIDSISKFISQAEKGLKEEWHSDIISELTLPYVMNMIESAAKKTKRKRTVLLLDDAALTLTKDYMIEFFDIFRTLKSQKISPKASVYPGTTEYGPRFHLKQDGDPFNVWFNPLGVEFIDFTNSLLEKRLGNINISSEMIKLLQYVAFGNPRAFITLVRDFLQSNKPNYQSKFNSVIETRCKLLKDEYRSIKQKLTQYNTIIEVGYKFFDSIVSDMANVNRENIFKNQSELNVKKLIVGLAPNDNNIYNRMIDFLIEAGLLYVLDTVKHGEDRYYKRYIPHLAFLFEKKAFSKGKGFNVKNILEYLSLPDNKHPIRKDNIESLIGGEFNSVLKLDLPKCSNCGAERLTEIQKFCHVCGNELIAKSSFEHCMSIEINDLPLTEWQKNKIISETKIRKVEDFVNSSNIGEELRKSRGIGIKRAEIIANKVDIWIEEFLG